MRVESKKSFLERLQSADEAKKRRWMIASTVIVMVIVIYVWLAYFNNLIAGMSEPRQVSAAPADDRSLWQIAEGNLSSLGGSLLDKARGLSQILQAPREYIINPPK
jgi:hypothetical protein